MSTSCLSHCPSLFFIKWTATQMFKYTCPTWPLTSSRQHGSQLEMHSALHENSRSPRTTGLRWIFTQGMRVWLLALAWSHFHYLWHLVLHMTMMTGQWALRSPRKEAHLGSFREDSELQLREVLKLDMRDCALTNGNRAPPRHFRPQGFIRQAVHNPHWPFALITIIRWTRWNF